MSNIEVVYNIDSDGLNLSERALSILKKKGYVNHNFDEDRANKDIVEVVKTIGAADSCEDGTLVIEDFDNTIYDFKIVSDWDSYNDGVCEKVIPYRRESYVKELVEKGDVQEVLKYFEPLSM